MKAVEGTKRARLFGAGAGAVSLAVVFLMVLGAAGAGTPGLVGHASSMELRTASSFEPAAIPATSIDINRSQSAGTYVPEYVTLNNSSTLVRIPVVLTVTTGTCKWVTVANATQAANPVSPFHNVEYANETTLNHTGTVLTHASGFEVCGATGVWLNFVYWTFSVYQFTETGLAVNVTVKMYGFSDWSGTTIAPKNVTATMGPTVVAQFKVASNLTFNVTFPAVVEGAATCDYTGQICSHDQYAYVSAADAVNVSTAHTIAFTTASALRVSGTWENWTVGYNVTSVSSNTQWGSFFVGTDSFFNEVFVTYWYLWVLVVLVVIVVAAVGSSRGRRHGPTRK
jgi:hypothetical protein